jgi:predicted DNA-binding transcriptional regulator AlpA
MRPLTINQFATARRLSRQRIWQLITDQRIPRAYRLGRAWVIPPGAEIIRGRRK